MRTKTNEDISFTYREETSIAVLLANKRVGTILLTGGGWRYFPKNGLDDGTYYPTLGQCKDSIEVG